MVQLRVRSKVLIKSYSSFFLVGINNRIIIRSLLSVIKFSGKNTNQIIMRNVVASKGYIEQQDKSFMDRCLGSLGKVNPLLRPEKDSETLTKYLQNFEQVSLYTDPYFGECYLLEATAVDDLRILRKQVHSHGSYQKRIHLLEQIANYNSNLHVINEEVVSKVTKTGFLFTTVEFYLSYDYILVDLQKEFQNRITEGNRFSQAQLMAIITSVSKGFIHIEPTPYNSVRMKNIYFCQRQIRVAHPKMFTYRTNLALLCEDQNQKGVYLAPEELDSLVKGDKQMNHGWRANSFVFGILVLALMSMQHLDELYNYSACVLNVQKMKELISYARTLYSERLISIVEGLLREKPQQRLTFRTLLNKMTERHQMNINRNVEITLIDQKLRGDDLPFDNNYKPITMEEQPHHTNYLAGLIYPKVGLTGEYFDQSQQNKAQQYLGGGSALLSMEDPVVANQRYYYHNRDSQYIGSGYSARKALPFQTQLNSEKPVRQGKGMYRNADGQVYVGDWHKGQMNGFGKIYWNQHKIRYEGQFLNGKFHGKGTQYPQQYRQDPDVDQSFVRLQRGNWMKYEGNYKSDKREGQGIAYFGKSKWVGNFKNGQPNGEGIYYNNRGQNFKGNYRQGIIEQ